MPINEYTPQKCQHDRMWAVSGTDLCLKHGGKIPATIAEANTRLAEARQRLTVVTPIEYAGGMEAQTHSLEDVAEEFGIDLAELRAENDRVSRCLLKERIETKLEEYRQTAEDDGIEQGLQIALQILEES